MPRLLARSFTALIAVLTLAGCGDDDLMTPTNPTAPTQTTVTFAGVVNRNGAQAHNFTTGSSGTVTAQLKFLVPDGTVKMGFALGTWNGASCQLVIAKTDAAEGTVLTGAVSALGSLCVYIHDVGNLQRATEYEIEVIHP
jgi:hypothetical protein